MNTKEKYKQLKESVNKYLTQKGEGSTKLQQKDKFVEEFIEITKEDDNDN